MIVRRHLGFRWSIVNCLRLALTDNQQQIREALDSLFLLSVVESFSLPGILIHVDVIGVHFDRA